MRTYPSTPGAPVLVLAHGAGAGQDHPWMKKVAAGLAGHGVTVVTFNFDYMEAGKRVPDRAPALEKKWAAVWREVADTLPAGTRMFAGGKSMGGRMASMAASKSLFEPAPAGLVFFGYPLHPPGKPDRRRDAHLPAAAAPMLFCHGTRDPFGTPDELRDLASQLGATLELVEGGDHSLVALKRDDPDRRSLDVTVARAAAWILGLPS